MAMPVRLIFPWVFAATLCGLRPGRPSAHQRDEEEIEIYAALLGPADGGLRVIEGTAQPFWYPMPEELATQQQITEGQKSEAKYFAERFDAGVQQSAVDDYFKRTLAASPFKTSVVPPQDWVILT